MVLCRYSRKNKKAIAEYIANQLKDKTMEQMTIQELLDPFKNRKIAISESEKAQKSKLACRRTKVGFYPMIEKPPGSLVLFINAKERKSIKKKN